MWLRRGRSAPDPAPCACGPKLAALRAEQARLAGMTEAILSFVPQAYADAGMKAPDGITDGTPTAPMEAVPDELGLRRRARRRKYSA